MKRGEVERRDREREERVEVERMDRGREETEKLVGEKGGFVRL